MRSSERLKFRSFAARVPHSGTRGVYNRGQPVASNERSGLFDLQFYGGVIICTRIDQQWAPRAV